MTRTAWNKGLHINLSHGKGQFKKGQIPWNKGTHINNGGNNYKTWFKKGELPPTTKPVGYIRKQKDGYTFIKIANPGKWQQYQRYVYEKAHKCKIPKNHLIIFLDGNRNNFNIDNLMEVTRHEAAIINHEHLQVKGSTDWSKAGALIAKLKIKIRKREKHEK